MELCRSRVYILFVLWIRGRGEETLQARYLQRSEEDGRVHELYWLEWLHVLQRVRFPYFEAL